MTQAPVAIETQDLDESLWNVRQHLNALRGVWPTLHSLIGEAVGAAGEEPAAVHKVLEQFSTLLDAPSREKLHVWDVQGYNCCNRTGAEAIRHLLKHGPSAGGEQSYNHEHCMQIAGDLEAQVKRNHKNLLPSQPVVKLTAAPLASTTDAVATVPLFKFQNLVNHCKTLEKQLADLQAQNNFMSHYSANSCWYWQADGGNFLDSIVSPILIQPQDLRSLIATKHRCDADDADVLLRVSHLHARLGRSPMPDKAYLAECSKCGWMGSSSECHSDTSQHGDGDVTCPACAHADCDEIDNARALKALQTVAFGVAL